MQWSHFLHSSGRHSFVQAKQILRSCVFPPPSRLISHCSATCPCTSSRKDRSVIPSSKDVNIVFQCKRLSFFFLSFFISSMLSFFSPFSPRIPIFVSLFPSTTLILVFFLSFRRLLCYQIRPCFLVTALTLLRSKRYTFSSNIISTFRNRSKLYANSV